MHHEKRRYRLSQAGLRSLRANAARVKPWERSTGPVTCREKQRACLNALKHGQRTATAIRRQQEIHHLLKALSGEADSAIESCSYSERDIQTWISASAGLIEAFDA